jgi:hypothetical protein
MINILIAIDQFFNALFRGDPDETLSSRGGKALLRIQNGNRQPGDWKWEIMCAALHIFDKHHCIKENILERDEGKF